MTADGGGYWLVASDGGIFSYGDAEFYGSTGPSRSTSPSSAWRPRPTARATGWWPPTAASSTTATPLSWARPAPSRSTSPSWAWPPRSAAATTSWPPTAASSAIPTTGGPALLRLDGHDQLNKPVVGMTDGGRAATTSAAPTGGLRLPDHERPPFFGSTGIDRAQPAHRGDAVGGEEGHGPPRAGSARYPAGGGRLTPEGRPERRRSSRRWAPAPGVSGMIGP